MAVRHPITEESVMRAMQEDLGKHRQEELPLSTITNRGPSYAPRPSNEPARYSSQCKADLKGKWSLAIEDEESEQMKGLSIPDPRPWDKKSLGLQRKQPNAKSASVANPPPAQVPQTATKQPENKLIPSNDSMEVGEHGSRVVQDPASTTKLAILPAAQVPAAVKGELVKIISEGWCIVKPLLHPAPWFSAKYSLEGSIQTNSGFLYIETENAKEIIIDVTHMNAPTMNGQSCFVEIVHGQPARLLIKLETLEATDRFYNELQTLRDAAFTLKSQVFAFDKTPLKLDNSPLIDVGDHPIKSANSPLIDLKDTPLKSANAQYSVEDLAIDLFELLDRTMSHCNSIQQGASEEEIEEAENIAIEVWSARGLSQLSLKSPTGELRKLFRSVIELRLKKLTKLNSRGGVNDSTAWEEIFGGLTMEPPRLQYSAPQILALRSKATTQPLGFTPVGRTTSHSAKSSVSSLGKRKSSANVDKGQVEVTVTQLDTSDQSEADRVATKISERPKARVRGLASSRWAK